MQIPHDGKFTNCPTIEALQNEYRVESDNVSMFLDEKMYIPSLNNKQLLSQLYNEFDTFAHENGCRSMSKKTFSSRIKKLGFKIERLTANQNYVWVEIGSKKNIANLVEAEDYFLDETESPF